MDTDIIIEDYNLKRYKKNAMVDGYII